MADSSDSTAGDIKPVDLRGILKYVPQFRNDIFVISLDGAIVQHENFQNLLVDIAVLRSLNINVVLTHGIGLQMEALGRKEGVVPSDLRGDGPTDVPTLELAVQASAQVAFEITRGLTQAGLSCAQSNAIRATELGVLGGRDMGHSGKVDKVNVPMVAHLLAKGIVPLLPPVAFTRGGQPLRINSDLLAADLALALNASKLIYLTPEQGLVVNDRFVMNAPAEEVRQLLATQVAGIAPNILSKAKQAMRALDGGLPRAHILDGRVNEGLLTEIFSKEGIGTMVHGNQYQQVRPARRADAQVIHNITRGAVRDQSLRQLTQSAIAENIRNFFVYEIDQSVIGCVRLVDYPDDDALEIASVYVMGAYQKRGIGAKLVDFALHRAGQLGRRRVFALSTQSVGFFKHSCGFSEASPDALPARRRDELLASGRNSKIFVRTAERGWE